MVPNFNLNYLSCMFLDIARFETTTTSLVFQIVNDLLYLYRAGAYGFRKWRGWREKLISRRGWRGKAYFTTGMTGTSIFHDGDKLILWWQEAHSWWENLDFLLNLCYKCWWILKRKTMHCGACRENNQAFSWTFNGLVKNFFSMRWLVVVSV